MSTPEVLLLALALAMDCFAVSIATGIMCGRVLWRPMAAMALCFGVFQAMMPVIGWAAVTRLSYLVEAIDHWIAFGILAFLGGRMIRESFTADGDSHTFDPTRPITVVVLSIATSIDALAVGISFACLGYGDVRSMAFSIAAIGLTSTLMSVVGLSIGIAFGQQAAQRLKPELIGGIILVLIGVRILVEHLTN